MHRFRGWFRLFPFIGRYRKDYAFGLFTLVWVDSINVALPLLIKLGLDAVPEKRLDRVFYSSLGILGLMAIQSYGRFLWRVYLMGASNRIAANLRRELYTHLQSLPIGYYQRVKTGDLMSRATNDVESVRMAVGPGILVACDAVIMFALLLPVMLFLSVKLTLLAFAFVPFVPWITRWVGSRIERIFDTLQGRMSNLSSFAQESFGAVRLIKSLVLESRAAERFSKLSLEYAGTGVRLASLEAGFSPVLGLITHLGTFLILWFGGMDVVSGAITLGTFVAFQRFVVQLSWPMEAIGWSVTLNQEGLAAYERLKAVMEVASNVDLHSDTPRVSSHSIHISRINFDYGGEFKLSIGDLEVKPGERIGLVGAVGSGKSTLFHLLLRLYEPGSDSIFIGERDILKISRSELRKRVASVEQQVFLFSETISSNIALGTAPPKNNEEVRRAMRLAEILNEIDELDHGIESVLGERGVNLSGGQKSRLALARALYRRPEILILDDCFAAVDVSVEHRIIKNLLSDSTMTMLVASQRMSVMPLLNEIWVFDRGRIVARGDHGLLLDRCDEYRKLWRKSKSTSDWGVA